MRTPIVLLLLLSACVSVSKSVLMDRSATPVPQHDVYVFLDNGEVPTDCERVALLNASGDDTFTNEGQMIDKLRQEAGKLGGNAILLQGMEDPGAGERFASALFGTRSDRDGQAVALWCPSRVKPDRGVVDTAGLVGGAGGGSLE